jgi:hypothetical protein
MHFNYSRRIDIHLEHHLWEWSSNKQNSCIPFDTVHISEFASIVKLWIELRGNRSKRLKQWIISAKHPCYNRCAISRSIDRPISGSRSECTFILLINDEPSAEWIQLPVCVEYIIPAERIRYTHTVPEAETNPLIWLEESGYHQAGEMSMELMAITLKAIGNSDQCKLGDSHELLNIGFSSLALIR